MNDENLIKQSDLTPSQRRERASRAGKASARARKQRKSMQETLEQVMSQKVSDDGLKEQIEKLGYKESEINNQLALTISVLKKAMQTGDYRAFEMIRDTLGEKPVENVSITSVPTVISGEEELED